MNLRRSEGVPVAFYRGYRHLSSPVVVAEIINILALLNLHQKEHEDRRAFSGRSYLLVRGCVHRLHRVVEVSERREST